MSPEIKKSKVIKCPHCGTVLPEGSDLCCEALKNELNALATNTGKTMEGLVAAFKKWFEDHEVKDANQ